MFKNSISYVLIVKEGFDGKTGGPWACAEQILTQLAAFTDNFCQLPVFFIE
jgi:hypothetical protein